MNWNWSGERSNSVSVQDTEDGKGVNVISDEDGNAAKAGIKKMILLLK
jgi:hypothetical protein